MNAIVMGIDPGKTTGVALLEYLGDSGELSYVSSYALSEQRDFAWDEIMGELGDLLQEGWEFRMVLERPAMQAQFSQTIRTYYWFMDECIRNQWEYKNISPGHWKPLRKQLKLHNRPAKLTQHERDAIYVAVYFVKYSTDWTLNNG